MISNDIQESHPVNQNPETQKQVKLVVVEGIFHGNEETVQLLQNIGGLEKVEELFNTFYEKMFIDQEMSKFITDINEPHGQRFAYWIVQKMTGNPIWSQLRGGEVRSASHIKAWSSEKREPSKMGRRFKVSDCRNWMRLNFWAGREIGLDQNKVFWDWYVQFIAHFMTVYERKAPPYSKIEESWSKDPENIKQYLENGRRMNDLYDNEDEIN